MAILKKIEGNELYLYMNGNLIYKRWLDTGQSKVFDVMAYDKYTLISIHDNDYENANGDLLIRAKLKLKSENEGARKTGIYSGYRPNHVFEYDKYKQFFTCYIGEIIIDGQASIEPGEEKEVTVRFMLNQPIEKYLDKGRIWWIHEGGKQIGHAEIL